ncbi:alpha/beta hydrolase [Gemmatimonas groenlandica]|uniref:Alpha/beta fold hydrolase n=1 Tax=Gemmatimonas groenlandica TaxID=2732249 RepID=A0A6M4IV18_9BACT|nr:alpha/beta fold hydrolase [Gemmatimonas groenlandica]QJR36662.1 alpha/beta fold hydrolase [Gemmatimonas groenlandica]
MTFWRAAARTRFEAEHARRFRVDAQGVVHGAAGFTLPASPGDGIPRRAVLLLHGFNDTAQSMAYLGAKLQARGWTVRAPLLPGHGRDLATMANESRAARWREAVLAEYDALRREYDAVTVVGQSMGGALALLLATERPDIPALVLLAPYVGMPRNLQWKVLGAWIARAALPYLRSIGGETSIHDPVARAESLGPGVVTARTLTELRRVAEDAEGALSRVWIPTLYVQSREDNRIAAHHAEVHFATLGSADKRLEWLTGCGHIISADYCRDDVATLTADWLDAKLV